MKQVQPTQDQADKAEDVTTNDLAAKLSAELSGNDEQAGDAMKKVDPEQKNTANAGSLGWN